MPRILQKRLTLFLLRTVTSSPVKQKRLRKKRKRRLTVPKAHESQTDSRAAENPASVSESATQTTAVPEQTDHRTAVLPQPKRTRKENRRVRTPTGNHCPEQKKNSPTPPANEKSTPPEPPKEEPTEPVFDIDYWISFAKSYAESIGTYARQRSPCIAGITPSPQV